jgi:hypothetical protein
MESKVSHARFYALLGQIPQANKEEWVWQYSNLRTTSLREFHAIDPQGYSRMIGEMQDLIGEINGHKANNPEIAELKRLRSAILHRLQKHGVDTTDWDKVNAFMQQPRIAGKALGKMSADEMRALIKKMQAVLSKDKAKRAEIERLQQLN